MRGGSLWQLGQSITRRLSQSDKKAVSRRCFASGAADLKKTALYDFHVAHGGKMVPFAGWSMPIQYKDSIIDSTVNCRVNGSLFDVAHMCGLSLKGKDCVAFLETLVVADVAGLAPGTGSLTVFTNEKGGAIDDSVITKVTDEHIYLVVAASFSLTSFISFISPFKSHTKPTPPPNLTLPTPTVSNRRRNDLAIESTAVAMDEPPSNASLTSSSELASVICPSLAYSNTLFFSSSGYNVQVFVEDNESEERLVNRFRREVMRTGVIQECKRRRYFENKQDEKKRRTRDAAKRNKKRRPFAKFTQETREEAAAAATKSKKKDEQEDNWDWEMPGGNVPS